MQILTQNLGTVQSNVPYDRTCAGVGLRVEGLADYYSAPVDDGSSEANSCSVSRVRMNVN
jgi:hypothetical protein